MTTMQIYTKDNINNDEAQYTLLSDVPPSVSVQRHKQSGLGRVNGIAAHTITTYAHAQRTRAEYKSDERRKYVMLTEYVLNELLRLKRA